MHQSPLCYLNVTDMFWLQASTELRIEVRTKLSHSELLRRWYCDRGLNSIRDDPTRAPARGWYLHTLRCLSRHSEYMMWGNSKCVHVAVTRQRFYRHWRLHVARFDGCLLECACIVRWSECIYTVHQVWTMGFAKLGLLFDRSGTVPPPQVGVVR